MLPGTGCAVIPIRPGTLQPCPTRPFEWVRGPTVAPALTSPLAAAAEHRRRLACSKIEAICDEPKPVNKVELLCRIKSLLRVRHLKSQLDRTLAYLAEVESACRAER